MMLSLTVSTNAPGSSKDLLDHVMLSIQSSLDGAGQELIPRALNRFPRSLRVVVLTVIYYAHSLFMWHQASILNVERKQGGLTRAWPRTHSRRAWSQDRSGTAWKVM